MSAHARRQLALRLIIAALVLAIPACWAAGRVVAVARWVRYRRNRRRRRIFALDPDGEWLTLEEALAFIRICRDWEYTAPAERDRA